jgi:hypothetical protein
MLLPCPLGTHSEARKRKSVANLVITKIISFYKNEYQHFQGKTKICPKVADRPPLQIKALLDTTSNNLQINYSRRNYY